jgi:hypothetical protein
MAHAVPSGSAVGAEHTPAAHVPAIWHVLAGHVIAAPLVHAPVMHTSPTVQALPSSHATPSLRVGCVQVP